VKFRQTAISGVVFIESDVSEDVRGSFSRVQSREEFIKHKIDLRPEQSSLSYNRKRGTVRGLHYQTATYNEAKLVCCAAGSAFDAVVDLRRSSPTYGRALWFDIAAAKGTMVYVPEGCAHGFQTLEDDTTLLYMISAPYDAAAASGIRWNDPALGIPWPEKSNVVLSDRDKSLPLLAQIAPPF
jgi:dTDP-4-dehydrorhamnose 3,5-epimerase